MRRRGLTASLARLVRERAGGVCEYCRMPQEWQEAEFHVDHVRPFARGGKTSTGNLALACVSCSLSKAARVAAKDPETGFMAHLFNPRRDNWNEHFEWGTDWRVVGTSAKGRATVAALAMNRARLVAIRTELAALGIFPPPSHPDGLAH